MMDFILETVVAGLGSAVKKLLGRPISKTGNSDMWLGAAILAVVFVAVIAFIRRST